MTDRQWWRVHGPALAAVVDFSRYPRAARIGTAVGEAFGTTFDVSHAFTYGLARILDGIERGA